MATLAADKVRDFGLEGAVLGSIPAVASDIIYEGAAVGSSSGNGRPLVALDAFLGFAVRKVDNSAGAAGAENIALRRKGLVVLPVTGVVGTGDVLKKVYASDDDTFTLTSTGNSLIGHVVEHITGTTCLVEFYPTPL